MFSFITKGFFKLGADHRETELGRGEAGLSYALV
jgi:hypothetical protein